MSWNQVGSSTEHQGTSSSTVSKPSGAGAGHIALWQVTTNGSVATPSGWTEVHNGDTANNGRKTHVLIRVLDGSEGSSFTYTPGAASITESMMTVFSGGDTGTPQDATAVEAYAATNITYSAITTVTNGALHVIVLIDWTNVTGTSTPSTYTLAGTSTLRHKLFFKEIAAAGAVSGVTSTGGGGDGYMVVIALRPSSGGGGGTAVPVFVHNLRQQGIA